VTSVAGVALARLPRALDREKLMKAIHRRVAVRRLGLAAGLATVALPGPSVASCGSAFCTVNTNWDVQGVWVEPGARVDVRFEYLDQDQPRAGSKKVAVGQIPEHHDEIQTINRNWFASFDYVFDANWGVTVTLPVVDRSHDHIHNHRGEQILESWNFTAIGDVRVVGRYQFTPATTGPADSPRVNVGGLMFGVKLPTGPFNETNAAGEPAERSLQPGTGTTDVLLGGYFRQSLPIRDFSWFAQALADLPLNTRDEFKPGNQLAATLGLRYEASPTLGLMLQLNALVKGRDSGAQAEPRNSGGQFYFLSPGLSYALTKDIQAYAFYQVPIYQYVNGVQLTANWSVVAGITARF